MFPRKCAVGAIGLSSLVAPSANHSFAAEQPTLPGAVAALSSSEADRLRGAEARVEGIYKELKAAGYTTGLGRFLAIP